MDKLKFTLFSIITLALVGIFGYWSVTTIQSGSEHVARKKIQQLEKENADLKKEVAKLASAIGALELKKETPEPAAEKQPEVPKVFKQQSLISELEKLASGNVFLELKSRGPAVGTVQNFLNIYNNTSNRADNDYGAGTKQAVAAFQKAVGLTADGEAGPSTFNKMIEWLKKQ
jgi:murein L,D-transpeptidase YcbB/YkuD